MNNNSFNCIIVDDEQDSIDLLAARLSLLYRNIRISGTFLSWESALEAMRSNRADIVFMDISMPGKDGISLLRLVPQIEAEIIFVTAHEEYALYAFEFSTSGYVLKPLNDMELSVAVNKAMERITYRRLANPHAGSAQAVKIGIPSAEGIDYVNEDSIMYFEAVNGYTRVVTTGGELLSSYSIGRFKANLGNRFFQVHRSYIVNLNYITRYLSAGIVVMENHKEIPLSKHVRDEFLNLFHVVKNK